MCEQLECSAVWQKERDRSGWNCHVISTVHSPCVLYGVPTAAHTVLGALHCNSPIRTTTSGTLCYTHLPSVACMAICEPLSTYHHHSHPLLMRPACEPLTTTTIPTTPAITHIHCLCSQPANPSPPPPFPPHSSHHHCSHPLLQPPSSLTSTACAATDTAPPVTSSIHVAGL